MFSHFERDLEFEGKSIALLMLEIGDNIKLPRKNFDVVISQLK